MQHPVLPLMVERNQLLLFVFGACFPPAVKQIGRSGSGRIAVGIISDAEVRLIVGWELIGMRRMAPACFNPLPIMSIGIFKARHPRGLS